MTGTPPFGEERIRATARELHDATDGTGCECGGKVPLVGVLTSGPWWQRGWYGLATTTLLQEDRLAPGQFRGSTERQHRERRQAE